MSGPPLRLTMNLTKDWNPQNDIQAIARAHRIGQTKTVKVSLSPLRVVQVSDDFPGLSSNLWWKCRRPNARKSCRVVSLVLVGPP